MKSRLENMPLEDIELVRKRIGENKEVTYTLNKKCPNCNNALYIVKELKEREVSCPHCLGKIKINKGEIL